LGGVLEAKLAHSFRLGSLYERYQLRGWSREIEEGVLKEVRVKRAFWGGEG